MSGYRHIIWDWNGTLLDDCHACVDVLGQVCRQYGKSPITYEQYRRRFDFPIRRFYETLGFDFQQQSYDQVAHDYMARYTQRQRTCRLQPGARRVLQDCRRRGVGQSVLSAYQQRLLTEIIDTFGLSHLFDHVVGLADVYAESKLQAGRFLLEHKLACPPEAVLLVGDTTHDVEVARHLGIGCLVLTRGHQHPDRLRATGTPTVDRLDEVLDRLDPQDAPSVPAGRTPHDR